MLFLEVITFHLSYYSGIKVKKNNYWVSMISECLTLHGEFLGKFSTNKAFKAKMSFKCLQNNCEQLYDFHIVLMLHVWYPFLKIEICVQFFL